MPEIRACDWRVFLLLRQPPVKIFRGISVIDLDPLFCADSWLVIEERLGSFGAFCTHW
jgi:hypothetical protein